LHDAFKLYVGSCTVLRKNQLSSFIQHIWQMTMHSEVKDNYNYRGIVNAINKAFDEAYEKQSQREGDRKYPGLRMEAFEDMLVAIAAVLKKTGSEIIFGLFEAAGISRDSTDCYAHVTVETVTRCHKSIAACMRLGKCHRCGNQLLPDSKYCRRCGQKRAGLASGSLRTDFDQIMSLARIHGISTDDVRKKKDLFMSCDHDGDNRLVMDEFKDAFREYLGLPIDVPIPDHVLRGGWATADRDGSGSIDFEEFLLWSLNTGQTYQDPLFDSIVAHAW